MKKTIFAGILAVSALFGNLASAQRSCGNTVLMNELRKSRPSDYLQLRERHQELARNAQDISVAAKTTAQHAIPVVFHIVVTQNQYIALGRDAGIIARAQSQLRVLNDDFNGRNADATAIPAAFKPLYANANIQFGLAARTTSATIANGVEVKILGTPPSFDINNAYRAAKEATTGLAAWDPGKFLNIWVIASPGGVLGMTVSPDLAGFPFGDRRIDETDFGIVLTYNAFGARESASQVFLPSNDLGRTLTHEMGHYFMLYHTWGDDDNDNEDGYCPKEVVNRQTVGFDDDIDDTPPQARRTYCDFPNHMGGNCPTYPLLDRCSPAAPGVMFMNFMDYVDDRAMQMFTRGQVAVMRREIAQGGASYSLTQNPALVSLSLPEISPEAFSIAPNPATSSVILTLNGAENLQAIQLTNLTGQVVNVIEADGRRSYVIPTAGLARGLYFVQCRFAEGAISRKIVLQ